MNEVSTRVLVTGGSRGIGLACARRFAAAGWRVALAARDAGTLDAAAKSLNGDGHLPVVADLTLGIGREALFQALGSWGEVRIVVQALGGVVARKGLDATEEDWQQTFTLNFHAVVALNQRLLSILEPSGGRLLHISSSAAEHGKASLPYCCAKAALNRYIRNANRMVCESGIWVGGVMPGAVEGLDNYWSRTRQSDPERFSRVEAAQPGGAFRTPEEIAECVWRIAVAELPTLVGKDPIVNLDPGLK